MQVKAHELGTLIETSDFIAFFGNRNAQVENLKKSFPEINFKRVHQVHGDETCETHSDSVDFAIKADAHWSAEKNLALCISTADCTPVLFYSPDMTLICGIHAGWRGVVQRIIPKAIEKVIPNASLRKNLQVFIGPHIQMNSFEVENSIRDEILTTCKLEFRQSPNLWKSTRPDKSLVDLHSVVKFQIAGFGIDQKNVWEELKDTRTDSNYHSYRRDKAASGRQQSFIVLK